MVGVKGFVLCMTVFVFLPIALFVFSVLQSFMVSSKIVFRSGGLEDCQQAVFADTDKTDKEQICKP